MPYELLYGTVHCTGRISYSVRTVATLDDAKRWCSDGPDAEADTLRVPETDPLRWCPVRHCHMKRQRPWRSYRKIPAGDEAPAAGEKT